MAKLSDSYVYGVIEQRFHDAGENIIKLGYTNQPFDEWLAEYSPSGFKIVFVYGVAPGLAKTIQEYLLKAARLKFVSRTEFGAEYFEAKSEAMMEFTANMVLPFIFKAGMPDVDPAEVDDDVQNK